MLPSHVVERIRNDRGGNDVTIAEPEPDVSILFCDVSNFKKMCSRYTGSQLVSLLDRIYSLFDEICAKHGVTKMETVGKTYVPDP